jgi:4-amino-4-deoxy-L-arabinose transferase-like glycosyltransferase
MSSQRKAWILVAGLVAIILLQLALIRGQGLWADEIFSLAMATGHSLEHPARVADAAKGDFVEPDHPVSVTEFRKYLRHESPPASPARVVRAVLLSDTSPPLYYLLLYGWTVILGTGDLQLRFLSITCFFACLPFLAAVARKTGGPSAVFASCVLFCFSPVSLYYSTEGRMYPLLWLCVLAIIWSSLALYQREGSIGLLAFWVVSSVAGFLTHYFFIFPWLAIVALLAIRPGSFHRMWLAACVLTTGVLILPWYLHLPESLERWRITSHWLNWEPEGFHRFVASCKLPLQFFGSSGRWTTLVSLLLFSFAFALLLWRLRIRLFVWRRLIVWLTFTAACAGPVIFDFVRHTYTVAVPRYALAALPPACVLGGLALTALRLPVRIVALILILGAWTPSIWSLYRDRTPWSSFRKIARAASVKSSPSDLILVHSIPSGVLGIARYADGPAAIASWVGQLGTQRVPQSLLRLAAGRKRILFVKVHEVKEPAPEEDWLRAHATIAHEMHARSGVLIDFRPVNAESF